MKKPARKIAATPSKASAEVAAGKQSPSKPYFASRKLTPAYRAARKALVGGPDSTAGISADRDQR